MRRVCAREPPRHCREPRGEGACDAVRHAAPRPTIATSHASTEQGRTQIGHGGDRDAAVYRCLVLQAPPLENLSHSLYSVKHFDSSVIQGLEDVLTIHVRPTVNHVIIITVKLLFIE